MTQTSSRVLTTAELVARCQEFDCLRPGLASVVGAAAPDLASIPPMDKTMLARALTEMLLSGRHERQRCYLFGSGGTTDAPKLSLIPRHLFVSDILECWRPLRRSDVLINLFNPGQLWSAHYFYNEIGSTLASETIALGSISQTEIPGWAELLETRGVTAIAGTPTTLKLWLRSLAPLGTTFARVGTFLWVGEPFDDELCELVEHALPELEPWGLYGSTETWVIGYNGPHCARDVFHPLPYQLVEVVGGEILVSNLHRDCVNPILRYRPGDRGEWSDCQCAAGRPGVRVFGRADSSVRFRNHNLTPEDVIRLARSFAEVAAAQLVVVKRRDGLDALRLHVVARGSSRPDTELIRRHVLDRSFDLKNMFHNDADGFQTVVVDSLATQPRTLKTPPLVTVHQ